MRPAPIHIVLILAALVLSFAGCGDEEDPRPPRERFDTAVADHDLVAARSAALDLGQELPDTPEAVIAVARLLGEIGEMNQARWMLSQALERHPNRPDLVLGYAETSLRVGDAAAARSALEGFPSDVEQSAYVEVLRARATLQLGELEEALAILERAHERFDEPVLFRIERIDLLAGENQSEEALAVLDEMKTDPSVPADVRIWLEIKASDLVGGVDGPEAAFALLDAVWADGVRSADVATRRTSLLVALGRAPEALADLRSELQEDPKKTALYPLAAQAAIATGDIAGAEVLYEQHVEVESTPTSLSNLALFLKRLGRVDEAARLLAELPDVADPVRRIELRYLAIALQIESGEADEVEKARARVKEFASDHPRNPRLGYLQARLDLADGNPNAAIEKLSDVVTRLDRADVKHLLGVALESAGDQAGAELRYGLAASQNPQQTASWLGLLRTLEAQGKWDRAANIAQRVIRTAPVGAFAYQALANAKIALGRPEEAEELLREYVARHPNREGPRVALSLALRRQGRAADALATLDEVDAGDEGDGANADLAAERAVVLAQLGRVAEAFDALAAVEVEDPAPRAIRHARIYVFFAADRGDEALAEAQRAAEVDPSDPVPHRMIADYLASHGRFEESVEPYRRALSRAVDGNLAFRLAVALENCDRDAEAIEAYRKAIAIDEDAIGPRNNIALLLSRSGAKREALEMAQSAYARAGTDPVVMDTLASLYLDAGLAKRAAALLEKARAADSTSAEIAYHLALAYRDSQRPAEARALLAELDARLQPEHELRGPLADALASLR